MANTGDGDGCDSDHELGGRGLGQSGGPADVVTVALVVLPAR